MTGSDVASELEIRGLVARYADAVSRRDEKAFAATFATDGEWQLLGNVAEGREKVVALWKALMANFPFVVQLATGGIIDVDGDRATGTWYITEHNRGKKGSGMLAIGIYRDDYTREEGRWCFARRRFAPLYMGPPDLSADPTPLPEGF